MKTLLLALLLILLPVLAQATPECTGTTHTITTASTAVLAASDVPGGRQRLLIQNTGAVEVFCTIGATATATNGFLLGRSEAWSEVSTQGPNGVLTPIPSGAVNCITASSTSTVVACDW